MLTFNLNYFIFTVVLFITEVLIAIFVHDSIIRSYFGDFLVVILLYSAVRSFLNVTITAMSVLVFSYVIECLQYFQIVQLLGLGSSEIANTIIGNYFAWMDILAYTLGTLFVLAAERVKTPRPEKLRSSMTEL